MAVEEMRSATTTSSSGDTSTSDPSERSCTATVKAATNSGKSSIDQDGAVKIDMTISFCTSVFEYVTKWELWNWYSCEAALGYGQLSLETGPT